MALFHSPMTIVISSTKPAPSLTPAKTKSSNCIILRTPCCVNIRLPTKTLSFFPIRATPLQKYVYPDPIPEFAVYETKKFREELKKKLYKERETFGDDIDRVLDTCAEVFSEFLHNEYGGPGTLLVEPFTYMLIELKQKKLQGANLAARASLLWAQNYLDQDWEIWNSN